MAFAQQTHVSHAGLGHLFHAIVVDVKDYMARRRVYKETLNELSALSGRDLADLGIGRSEIRALALEAAYGDL